MRGDQLPTYLPISIYIYLYLSTTTTSPLVTTQSDDEVVVWCDAHTLMYAIKATT